MSNVWNVSSLRIASETRKASRARNVSRIRNVSSKSRTSRGFTLLDLLISIAIASLLLGIALPSYSHLISKSKVRALQTDVIRALAFAKTHSVNTGKLTTICGIDMQQRCIKDDIQQLAVFIDTNKNAVIDEGEDLLQMTQLSLESIYLRASFGNEYIRFTYSGAAKQSGSFIYCSEKHPRHSRRIIVSMPGRFYSGRDNDGDGIVEDGQGDNIEC